MCKKFSGQNPEHYRRVSRSVRIGGHSTSIQLENAFWSLIGEIAAGEGMSASVFLSTIHEEAQASIGPVANFSSLLRTCCLIHLMPPNEGAPRN